MLGDTWAAEERGKAIAIYSLAPLLGPVIGPVCGGWSVSIFFPVEPGSQSFLYFLRIAERSTWRWVFWATSIVDVMIQLSGFFFLRESDVSSFYWT